jgi:hypothetical protein
MMKKHNIPYCLFYNPANIRYATGTDVMGIWTASTLARYYIVSADAAPVLFDYPNSMHVAQKLVRNVRPALSWRSAEPPG